MAAVVARRMVLARLSAKFRVALSGRELPLNFYCLGYSNFVVNRSGCAWKNVRVETRCVTISRYFSEDAAKQTQSPPPEQKEEPKKKTLLQRFKEMYKNYWYVLVPVHLVTSAFWFGSFYYLAKSGVDVVSILENMNFSETLIKPFRDSSMGYVAVAYALYKIATPLRYTVTLGGTTISINYLKKWGYIKPVPSKAELKEMYYEKKENLMDSVRERREELWHRTDRLMGKKDLFMDEMKDRKESLEKNLKDKTLSLEKSLKQTQSKILQKKDEVFRLKNQKD